MLVPRPSIGVALAGGCLGILGVLPILAGGRPAAFDALGFAFCLSLWQTVFALPLVAWELRAGPAGIFAAGLRGRAALRSVAVILGTGALFGLSTYLYVLGVDKAGAVSAAIALQAYPLFAILWETLFLKRRKTAVELLLTVVLVGALYYLGTAGTGRIAGLSPWVLVTLGVPFLWSVAHVVIKEELGRTPITPAQVTLFRVSMSAVVLGLAVLAVNPDAVATALWRPDFQMAGMVMGLMYYLELMAWFHAVRHIAVSLASSIVTPSPALTMVLAVTVLGDPVEPYQVGAFVVVAASVYGLVLAGLRR
jgi:drug/metabolite transporter (DMT)-like permease